MNNVLRLHDLGLQGANQVERLDYDDAVAFLRGDPDRTVQLVNHTKAGLVDGIAIEQKGQVVYLDAMEWASYNKKRLGGFSAISDGELPMTRFVPLAQRRINLVAAALARSLRGLGLTPSVIRGQPPVSLLWQHSAEFLRSAVIWAPLAILALTIGAGLCGDSKTQSTPVRPVLA